ncbi:MAG TPA: ROK family transcriptional regulator [Candidatus Limnocylindrales bacterium]|jgi:predicted NBD/HSP70 family sugar kinase|nr:ROK family transcriptional regulator [Candidatus Limnocylindrales bacterium]
MARGTGLPGKATHRQTRAHNQGLVLRTLFDRGPVSRAEVARLTGLTRTTVSELVGEFVADGLAREVGRGPSSGGKAPILVQVVDEARHVIGLDLGERAFSGAVVNLRGEIGRTATLPVDGLDGDAALAVVYRLVDELTADGRGTLLGIGVGTPGIVDAEHGTIRWAVNLDWQDLPLGRLLQQRYGVATYVANDSRAAALAEYLYPGDSRTPNLVAIKVGQGIGAGVVLGGELFHGDGFGAGEIGHTTVVDDGDPCRCGRFGCLETVASSRAILARATEAGRRSPGSPLGLRLATMGALDIADVRAALDAGDEDAAAIVAAAGRFLGQAVAGLIGALNVHRIVLLGSVAALGDAWLAAVRDEATRRALGMLAGQTRIELGRTAEDVVVLGASALLMTRELGLVPGR